MKWGTDRQSNPFGMQAPNDPAVYGYGDVNADIHIIGFDGKTHGGLETGIPFTQTRAGYEIQSVLAEVDLLADSYADLPEVSNTYLSYYRVSSGDAADLERYVDAEIRAINAHVLCGIGDEVVSYLLDCFSTVRTPETTPSRELHATEVRGRGFLLIPIIEPMQWDFHHREEIVTTLRAVLTRDYRQTKGVPTRVG